VPLTLKAQARGNLVAYALAQHDFDIVHQIITTIEDHKDPYLNWIAVKLNERAEGLGRKPQQGRSEARVERKRLDTSSTTLDNERGRTKHRTIRQAASLSRSRTLSPQRSPARGNVNTPEVLQFNELPTPSTPSNSSGSRAIPNDFPSAAKDTPQKSVPSLPSPITGNSTPSPQHPDTNTALDQSAKSHGPAFPTSVTSEKGDPLGEEEHFIKEIKSHQY
jgi:hypothetical protein